MGKPLLISGVTNVLANRKMGDGSNLLIGPPGRIYFGRHDPEDRRRVIVTAETERGGELARRYAPMGKAITKICSEYSQEELTRIVAFLERVTEAGAEVAAEMRRTID
jgi:hypothetical protein